MNATATRTVITVPEYWDEACRHLMKRDRVMKRLIPQFGEACLQSRGDAFVRDRRRGHRRMRLLDCIPHRHQDPGAYCQKQDSSPVENIFQIHNSSTVKDRCC